MIEEGTNFNNPVSLKNFAKSTSIQRVKTSKEYRELLRRITSVRIDMEKAQYQTDLIWDQEKTGTENEDLFERNKKISIFRLYYILFEKIDYLYLVLGLIGCLAAGTSTPLIYFLNAEVYTDVGKTSEQRGTMTEEELMIENVKNNLNDSMKKKIIFGAIAFVDNFIAYFFIGIISTRTLYNFKKTYFRLIFSQEQGWFDSTNIFNFATKVQTQIENIEAGLGDSLIDAVTKIFIAIGSLIFAFIGSWRLSLVILCLVPLMVLSGILLSNYNVKAGLLVTEVYKEAGGIAEEILYNIKIIISFANFEYELKRYYEKIEIATLLEQKCNIYTGIFLSILYLCQVLSVFLGLIYGRTLIKVHYNRVYGRDTSGGDINLTFNCIVTLISVLFDIFNDISDINRGLSVTVDFFYLYERKPQMDLTNSVEKPPLSNIQGNIEFRNVSFYYPSDEEKTLILNNINFNFEAGKKFALIGESGSGKTTVANLIERLYDVNEGEIIIDGLNIRNYDIQYLRNLIGYCEQEPILFNRSIRDNIIFGREDFIVNELGMDVEQLLQTACEEAYVSEFLDKVPGGLDYMVGVRGGKLSGGQKQRIAIARAILTKPKILLLDEATSALDNKSEQIVQKALDNISKRNITTIVIAQKMSTIRNSDLIYVLKDGNIFEQGKHDELIQKGGYYEKIIRSQLLQEELENHNKKDEYIRKMSSLKKVNTDEEVHFDRRDEELSISTDNVRLQVCKIFKILWKYRCTVIFGFLFTIIYGALPVAKGYFSGEGTVAISSDYETIRYDDGLKYSIIYLIVGVLHVLAYCFYCILVYKLGIDLTKNYRNMLLKKYLSLHIAFFDIDRNSPGSLLSRMAIDTVQLMYSFKLILGNLIAALSTLVTTLIWGVVYEYRITLITFVFLALLIILTLIRRFCVQVDSPKSLAAAADGGRILSECVVGTKTIFSYNFSRKALNLYLEAIDYITQRLYKDNFINSLTLSLMILCNYIMNIIVFALSKRYIINGTLDSDEMTVVQTIIIEGYSNISGYMTSIWRIRKAIASLRSVYSILDTPSLICPFKKDNLDKISANNIKGKIEFRNVYFAYPFQPEHVILKNISFTILPGQKVALVGNSGCGKSSVIQLINRFYDVEDGKGEILIDDINIKDYNLYELKKKIGFVQQEPSAFKRSNLENIRYGSLEATDEECYEAAKKVNALNLLEIDKMQNLKKQNLSGGDKQKLAIGRIFLKNPPILLLDEPTSNLDKDSEVEIEKSLEILAENKTTITIAHRLNTIENCDKIIVFDDGRIKEEGTHEELMKLKKRYYTLYKFSNLS